MVFYESHGTEKSGFEYTMRHMLVRAKRLKGIDVAKGMIFSTFGAAPPSVTAQFEDDEGEAVDYLHSDYDSVIKGFATSLALTRSVVLINFFRLRTCTIETQQRITWGS